MDIEELRQRLSEAEGNLQAIYSGEIDALLLSDEKGERRVFTLRSADAPYRALVERMQEAVKTIKGSRLGGAASPLYELPWYAVIGNPAAGKSSAVVSSGLNFPFVEKTDGDRYRSVPQMVVNIVEKDAG